MPQFFLNKRLIVLLVSIILLVALIGISLKERNSLTWPEQFVKDTVGVVERVFQKPAKYVAGFFENVEDVKRTYEENKELKAKLDNYAGLSGKVKQLEDDNKKLQELTGKDKLNSGYTEIPATVVSRNPDKWYDLVGLDKGTARNKKRYGCINSTRFSGTSEKCISVYIISRIVKFYEPNKSCFCYRTRK